MNLFSFIGAATSPVKTSREKKSDRVTERARVQWVDRLRVDEMRAWMSIGEEEQIKTLNGLATMLTIAGLVMARVHGQIEHPGVRVVRSALNVVRECADRRATIDEVRIVTIQVACREATAAIKAAPKEAIHYAAIKMHAIAREL